MVKEGIHTKKIWLIFLPLVCWLFMNATINQHAHLLTDGCLIYHAHPFNKSADTGPVKSHSHSENELLILSIISNPLGVVLSLGVVIPSCSAVYHIFNSNSNSLILAKEQYQVHHYHAPPA